MNADFGGDCGELDLGAMFDICVACYIVGWMARAQLVDVVHEVLMLVFSNVIQVERSYGTTGKIGCRDEGDG